jgi:hypothetical protein
MAAGAYNALGAAPLAAPDQPTQTQASPFLQYLQRLAGEQATRRAPVQHIALPQPLQASLPQANLAGLQPSPSALQQMLALQTQRNPLMSPDQNANPLALMMMMQQPEQTGLYL